MAFSLPGNGPEAVQPTGGLHDSSPDDETAPAEMYGSRAEVPERARVAPRATGVVVPATADQLVGLATDHPHGLARRIDDPSLWSLVEPPDDAGGGPVPPTGRPSRVTDRKGSAFESATQICNCSRSVGVVRPIMLAFRANDTGSNPVPSSSRRDTTPAVGLVGAMAVAGPSPRQAVTHVR